MKSIPVMPLDHQLREAVVFENPDFPIQYYVDDLSQWHNHTVPLHWHKEYEIFTAMEQEVLVQVGTQYVTISKGETIFINGNQLHGYSKSEEQYTTCLCPNIVFSGELLASATSAVYQKYFHAVLDYDRLPYLIIPRDGGWNGEISEMLEKVYTLLSKYGAEGYYARNSDDFLEKDQVNSECYELDVLQCMLRIFKTLYLHREELSYADIPKQEHHTQIRIQKMVLYIQHHYQEKITLTEISAAAGISRSEAGRCFRLYYDLTPLEYVIKYRLEQAQKLLISQTLSVNEIGYLCGFSDTSYFIRCFRKVFDVTPSDFRKSNRGIQE